MSAAERGQEEFILNIQFKVYIQHIVHNDDLIWFDSSSFFTLYDLFDIIFILQ